MSLTPPAIAPTYQQLVEVAVKAATLAGEEMRSQRRTQSVAVSLKGARDLVTSADIAAEKIIIETIRSHFPDHAILAEESSQGSNPISFNTGYVWVIDPVDGTTNYAHDHPHVGVSIACALDGESVAGAVLAPFLNEIFTAYRGGGAYLNGEAIHTSKTDSIESALIATGFPYGRSNVDNICDRLARILKRCRDIRRLGAASLDISWVACGRLDAFYEETLNPWDCAAGRLIAREAGAKIGHFAYDSPTQKRTAGYTGDLFVDNLVVSAPGVFEDLIQELNRG